MSKRLVPGYEYPKVNQNGDLQISADTILQEYIKYFGDRTLLTGGAISDNGNDTAAIASLTAWCKVTDSDTAVGKFFSWAGGNTPALADVTTSYVYLDYNDGVPQLVVATSVLTYGLKQDHIHIGTIFNNSSTLHWHQHLNLGIGRVNRADLHWLEHFAGHRVTGLVTSNTGLALSITTGVLYEGLDRVATTVNGSTWSTWYRTNSVWTEVTGQSAIDNAQYNKTDTGLVNFTANRYGTFFVYADMDGAHLQIVYGAGNVTINEAEEAGVPDTLPNIVTNYGVLIAKIIVQQGQTSLIITYPWTVLFTSSLATDHGSLGGLGDDDHTQYTLHSLATAENDVLVASGVGAFIKKTLAELKTLLAIASDIATHAAIKAANATLGHVIVETASDIDVDGDGKLTLGSHKTRHQDTGDDEIVVTGLAGLLADDQHVLDSEVTAVAVAHSLATAVSDFLAASGAGVFVKKTLAEVKTILGLGSAAYTAATDYVTHALATAANDFIVASGSGVYVKKTLAEVKNILGLGTAAYTAATDYVTHALATAENDMIVASGVGVYIKKTLAEVKTLLGIAADIATHADNTTTAHGAVSAATASKFVVRDASARAKFAAPGASGDALIKGTRVTTAELPAMTDEKIWVGTGGNVEERDVPVTATKELTSLCSAGTENVSNGTFGGYRINAAAEYADVQFRVPHDFSSIIEAVILVLPTNTSTQRLDITCGYGTVGEAWNTHFESDLNHDFAWTLDELTEIDISGILSSLAADDEVGIELIGDAVNTPEVVIIQVRFKYA